MKSMAKPSLATSIGSITCAIALASMGIPRAHAEETKALAPVEVIGTRLKRVDLEPPTPIEIITAEQIRRSGALSLGELLTSNSSSSSGGVLDVDLGSSFSSGASTISLRGLGSHATLTLLNGRRITASPYADPNTGQSLIFNLNAIPLSAVERIEILKSGASAIYGSDALAGVVNIVLRKDYQGTNAGVSYSGNYDGEFGNRQVSGMLGFGNPATDGYNATIMFENSKRNATRVVDTHKLAESDLTTLFGRNTAASSTASYPGNYFREQVLGDGAFTTFVGRDSRCPASLVLESGRCGYNFVEGLNTVSAQDSNAVMGRINFDAGSGLSLFTEFGLAQNKNRYIGAPVGIAQTGAFWFAQDGSPRSFQFILPTGHPDNPAAVPVAVRYRFADIGPNVIDVKTDTNRLLFGAKGSRAGWDWESAVLYMRIKREQIERGMLYLPALTDAINSLAYRPFGNNSAQTLASISPGIRETGQSTNTSWDLKASRELMELTGGPMALAAGMEVRREQLTMAPDPRAVIGDFIGAGTTFAQGDRRVSSLFAELSAPFIKQVETQLAFRFDHYSDYGNSTTPQLALKWKPFDTVALRGSYAKGFRAPSLSTIGNSSLQGGNSNLFDPLRCDAPGGTPEDCDFSSATYIRGNPNLQPEKSDTQTIGLLLSPHRNLDLAVDFYRIDRTNEINLLTARFTINNEALFPGAVVRDPNPATWLPGVPNSGPIQSTIRRFHNLGRTVTRGVDMGATLRTSLGDWGKLTTEFHGSYLIRFKNKLRNDEPYLASQGAYGPMGELPRFKGSLSTTWTYHAYALTARVNHVSGWRYGDNEFCYAPVPEFETDYGCRIKPWTTLDLQLTHTGKNLDLGFGIRNVLNKSAPLDPDFPDLGYNPSAHNPYGRYFNIWMNYKF